MLRHSPTTASSNRHQRALRLMPNYLSTLVVIPAFNEESSIGEVVTSVQMEGWSCLVVDDGSTDQTRRLALEAGSTVLSLAVNQGVGAALQAGFRYAILNNYERVVQCDADGQHGPDQIATLVVTAMASRVDLVVGSRWLDTSDVYNINRARRLAQHLLSKLFVLKSGVRLNDTTSGFRCINFPLLNEFGKSFSSQYLGDTFEAHLVAATNGYSILEVGVGMNPRTHGSPSASGFQSLRYILRIIIIAILGLTFRVQSKEKLTLVNRLTPEI